MITKNRIADNAKVGVALAPSIGLEDAPHQPKGNRVTDNVVERSGMVDLGVVLSDAADAELLLGQHVLHVGAREHRAGDAVRRDRHRRLRHRRGRHRGSSSTRSGNAKGVRLQAVAGPEASAQHAGRRDARRRVPAGAPPPVDLAAIQVPAGS